MPGRRRSLQGRVLALVTGAEADQDEGMFGAAPRPVRRLGRLADRPDMLHARRKGRLQTECAIAEGQEQREIFDKVCEVELRACARDRVQSRGSNRADA